MSLPCSPESFLLKYQSYGFTWPTLFKPLLCLVCPYYMDARYHLRDDTQATDDPHGSPCAWCILLTPLGLIPRESWFRVITRYDWTSSHTASPTQHEWNIERERTRLLWWPRFPEIWERVLRSWPCYELHASAASFEEIWFAVAEQLII